MHVINKKIKYKYLESDVLIFIDMRQTDEIPMWRGSTYTVHWGHDDWKTSEISTLVLACFSDPIIEGSPSSLPRWKPSAFSSKTSNNIQHKTFCLYLSRGRFQKSEFRPLSIPWVYHLTGTKQRNTNYDLSVRGKLAHTYLQNCSPNPTILF